MNETAIVFYHKDCTDGFAAAFAAWLALKDKALYVPCAYGNDVGADVRGKDVYVLDFSFEPQVLEALSRKAASLTLLDHHASAEQKLKGFKPLCCGKIHFDLAQSGAMLAWKHFHPGKPAPYLFKCVQSRDLWRWDVPGDRHFLSWLDTQPFDFDRWQEMLDMTAAQIDKARQDGLAMSRKFDHLVQSIAAKAVPVRIAGHEGLMVNASSEFSSDVGNVLANRCGTFALVWKLDEDSRLKCSLRSTPDFDCSQLAALFGGGGHPGSSAFRLAPQRIVDLARGHLDP